jgi:hypothetical protein
MRDHALMPKQGLRPEDFDYIDESDLIQVNEARPVRGDQVTTILSVPLTHDQANALDDVADLDGKTIFDAARDAIDAYIATRLHKQSARRRAS